MHDIVCVYMCGNNCTRLLAIKFFFKRTPTNQPTDRAMKIMSVSWPLWPLSLLYYPLVIVVKCHSFVFNFDFNAKPEHKQFICIGKSISHPRTHKLQTQPIHEQHTKHSPILALLVCECAVAVLAAWLSSTLAPLNTENNGNAERW